MTLHTQHFCHNIEIWLCLPQEVQWSDSDLNDRSGKLKDIFMICDKCLDYLFWIHISKQLLQMFHPNAPDTELNHLHTNPVRNLLC